MKAASFTVVDLPGCAAPGPNQRWRAGFAVRAAQRGPVLQGWGWGGAFPKIENVLCHWRDNLLDSSMPFLRPLFSAAALSVMLAAAPAEAAVVVSQLGADDPFGILSGDALFLGGFVQGPDFGEFNDGGITVQLAASWSQPLVSAQLEVFSGGWGYLAPAQLFLNGQLVGDLTVGDAGSTATGDDLAFLDTFDLTARLGDLAAVNNIEIRPSDAGDGGILGLVRLTLRTQDTGTGGNTVPEPASVALAGLALVGALATRRRRT